MTLQQQADDGRTHTSARWKMSQALRLIHAGFAASLASLLLVIVPSQVLAELGYHRSRYIADLDFFLLPIVYTATFVFTYRRMR
ncbi:hypothetical protein VI08_03370 [Luteibacter yeojuensis]|uniref:Uncharacterized protein n=1 Tax=Luteibacter yeojuensis TaxID=345309 RepID=A0A0F3L0R5_9GAMM|nr:hypothetical protein VI08_03370 [Luteibacter yeojuensis]